MPTDTAARPSSPATPISDDSRSSPPTMLQKELDALEHRFAGHDGDELMMSLKHLVTEHITRPQNDE